VPLAAAAQSTCSSVQALHSESRPVKDAAHLRDPSLLTILAAGFAATVAQILLLRELLVLFYGNEMSTALVLAGWLLWTALGSATSARLARRMVSATGVLPAAGALGVLLTLQALGLPALVLAVRGARHLLGIPLGELAPLGKMLLICLGAPVLSAPVAGALFGWCWAYRRARHCERTGGGPLTIYLGEALGAAAGGIAFYLVLLRFATAWTTTLMVAATLLAIAGLVVWSARAGTGSKMVWIVAVIVVSGMAIVDSREVERGLDARSRRWQWGPSLAAVRDTPFHNMAILENQEQVTIFTNGLWLLTEPDPATAELAVHPVLLQHPEPRRILLLGGGLAGQIEEVLRHPGVERVDYVEQDPELVEFAGGFLDAATLRSLGDPRVRIEPLDAGTFLRRTAGQYDVVSMSVGDPINAQMNRFFTVEHFRRVREHLRPGGIFTFSVAGGGDLVGPSHARLIGALERTLEEVFTAVRVLPGARARFFAAGEESSLVLDGAVLAARITERGLGLVHVRWDTLEDLMSPTRLDYLDAVLEAVGQGPVNRQFAPICYFHGMMLWASQWHPRLVRWIGALAAIRLWRLFLAVGALGVAWALFVWTGKPRYRAAVGASVLVQGAWGMVLQVVLILSFQILAGFAYLQLALIIAFFMAGLAVGALGVAALRRLWGRDAPAVRWLVGLQAVVTVVPLVLVAFVSPPAEGLREGLSLTVVSTLFTATSFLSGVLGGAHFSLAVLAATVAGARLERAGGYLYAVDLAGAAAGALVAGLFVLPLYGVSSTLVLLSLVSLVCLVALLRRPDFDQTPGTG